MLIDLFIYLKKHNITQRELAERTGIERTYLCRVINGKHRFNRNHIERIRREFPGIDERMLRPAA